MISVGMTSETRLTVKDEDTALAWGSGTLPVLATPRMVLMAEQAAMAAVAGELPAGDATVGTLVDIEHVSPSPVGTEVVCRVSVVEVDRARVRFAVSARDASGEVGRGFHERFVVHSDRFMEKAARKLRRAPRP